MSWKVSFLLHLYLNQRRGNIQLMVWVDCVIFTVINGLSPSEVVIKQLPAIIISLCSQKPPLRPCFVSGPQVVMINLQSSLHTRLIQTYKWVLCFASFLIF